MAERDDVRKHPPTAGTRDWFRMAAYAEMRLLGTTQVKACSELALLFDENAMNVSTGSRWECSDWWPEFCSQVAEKSFGNLQSAAILAALKLVEQLDPGTVKMVLERLDPRFKPRESVEIGGSQTVVVALDEVPDEQLDRTMSEVLNG